MLEWVKMEKKIKINLINFQSIYVLVVYLMCVCVCFSESSFLIRNTTKFYGKRLPNYVDGRGRKRGFSQGSWLLGAEAFFCPWVGMGMIAGDREVVWERLEKGGWNRARSSKDERGFDRSRLIDGGLGRTML